MTIYQMTDNALIALNPTRFGNEGIFERRDIQRLLKENISILSDDLMVIAEEFCDWEGSSRRIDLLCLDRSACPVVVELKRTEDGGHMDLQAIRYAAMISKITFDRLIEIYVDYNSGENKTQELARTQILNFLNWDEPQEDIFADKIKIILAASDFSKELTTTVLWLNDDYDLDIKCIRLKPYKSPENIIFVDVQQIIPLPESAEYQTKIRAKESEQKVERVERHELRYAFWQQLLTHAKTKTLLHANRRPTKDNWIGGGIGKSGLSLNYVVREHDSQVEFFIGTGDTVKNEEIFNDLLQKKKEIESSFQEPLVWEDLAGRKGCRIRKLIQGGWRSPQNEWANIHEEMIAKMISLHSAIKPFI